MNATVIRLRTSGGYANNYPAIVCGQWAAHPRFQGYVGDIWDVTHVPTGLAIPQLAADEADAIRVAHRLGALLPDTLTVAEVVKMSRSIKMVCAGQGVPLGRNRNS